jgi:hypothetical protein
MAGDVPCRDSASPAPAAYDHEPLVDSGDRPHTLRRAANGGSHREGSPGIPRRGAASSTVVQTLEAAICVKEFLQIRSLLPALEELMAATLASLTVASIVLCIDADTDPNDVDVADIEGTTS